MGIRFQYRSSSAIGNDERIADKSGSNAGRRFGSEATTRNTRRIQRGIPSSPQPR